MDPTETSSHRASPRNVIIERSTSTSCSDVIRPTRVRTFDRRTAVNLSIMTSLSRSRPAIVSRSPGMRIRNIGASMSWLVIGATIADRVERRRPAAVSTRTHRPRRSRSLLESRLVVPRRGDSLDTVLLVANHVCLCDEN